MQQLHVTSWVCFFFFLSSVILIHRPVLVNDRSFTKMGRWMRMTGTGEMGWVRAGARDTSLRYAQTTRLASFGPWVFFFLFSVGTLISYDNIQKFRLILSKLNSFHEKFIY